MSKERLEYNECEERKLARICFFQRTSPDNKQYQFIKDPFTLVQRCRAENVLSLQGHIENNYFVCALDTEVQVAAVENNCALKCDLSGFSTLLHSYMSHLAFLGTAATFVVL